MKNLLCYCTGDMKASSTKIVLETKSNVNCREWWATLKIVSSKEWEQIGTESGKNMPERKHLEQIAPIGTWDLSWISSAPYDIKKSHIYHHLLTYV